MTLKSVDEWMHAVLDYLNSHGSLPDSRVLCEDGAILVGALKSLASRNVYPQE